MNLTSADVDRIATALAGKLRHAAPAGPIVGTTCTACGHVYAATEDDRCPNNNCVRHDHPEVVGLHPATGEPVFDAREHAEAVDEHLASQK